MHRATPEQARLLLDPRTRHAADALMKQPQTVGELAAGLGVSPRRAYTLVSQLCRADIAEVCGERPRAGRALKVYRVPGPWFIPFAASPAGDLADFLGDQVLPGVQAMLRLGAGALAGARPHWGYWLQEERLSLGDESGEIFDATGGGDLPLISLGGLRLSDADAGELAERLGALGREFAARSAAAPPGTARHSLALLLVRGAWHQD